MMSNMKTYSLTDEEIAQTVFEALKYHANMFVSR